MSLQELWRWLSGTWRRLVTGRLPPPVPAEAAAPVRAPRLQIEAAPPKACVSVIIPALNEAARIAEVVRYALGDPATGEVIVVDDSSIDDRAARARCGRHRHHQHLAGQRGLHARWPAGQPI